MIVNYFLKKPTELSHLLDNSVVRAAQLGNRALPVVLSHSFSNHCLGGTFDINYCLKDGSLFELISWHLFRSFKITYLK